MTQREIDKRTGLKGRTRQFTFPVSESKFSGIELCSMIPEVLD